MRRELRTCPLTGEIALLNEAWPETSLPASPSPRCWFCQDSVAAPTISVLHRTRSVPHPTPALGIEGSAAFRRIGAGVARDGVGAHEVIFGEHDGADAACLRHAADRIADLRRDARLRGFGIAREAAPGRHVAWHVVAFPFDTRPMPALGWRDTELDASPRLVARRPGAVAIAAIAPRVAFETWVVPEGGAEPFGGAGIDAVAELASDVLGRLYAVLGAVTVDLSVADGEPWLILLRPRLTQPSPTAALDLPCVGVFPETAARVLRGVSREG